MLEVTNPLPIVEYDAKEAIISDMFSKYEGMKIVDAASRKTVKEGLRETVKFRVEVEDLRLENGRKIMAIKKQSDEVAKAILARVAPLEIELRETRDKDEEERAKVKAEKARLDQERVDGIRKQIDVLRGHAENIATLSSDDLRIKVREILTSHVDESIFEEFTIEANGVRLNSLNVLKEALKTKMQLEKEDAERKAEAERLEKIRLEQEAEQKRLDDEKAKQEAAAQAERDRIAEEQRKIDEEKARIEADKKAEADRKDREEFEAKAKEEAQIQAEKDAREKAEKEKEDRIAKEKAEAEEKSRQEALKPDKQKAIEWVKKFNEISIPEVKNRKIKQIIYSAIDDLEMFFKNLLDDVEAA